MSGDGSLERALLVFGGWCVQREAGEEKTDSDSMAALFQLESTAIDFKHCNQTPSLGIEI